jgi:hypothetical protein
VKYFNDVDYFWTPSNKSLIRSVPSVHDTMAWLNTTIGLNTTIHNSANEDVFLPFIRNNNFMKSSLLVRLNTDREHYSAPRVPVVAFKIEACQNS